MGTEFCGLRADGLVRVGYLYIRNLYPLKNVSTLQPSFENYWKSVKKWLKGLIFKPFSRVQRCRWRRVRKEWGKAGEDGNGGVGRMEIFRG